MTSENTSPNTSITAFPPPPPNLGVSKEALDPEVLMAVLKTGSLDDLYSMAVRPEALDSLIGVWLLKAILGQLEQTGLPWHDSLDVSLSDNQHLEVAANSQNQLPSSTPHAKELRALLPMLVATFKRLRVWIEGLAPEDLEYFFNRFSSLATRKELIICGKWTPAQARFFDVRRGVGCEWGWSFLERESECGPWSHRSA